MKLFQCENCQFPLFFENTQCVNCGYHLGYSPDEKALHAYQQAPRPLHAASTNGNQLQYCENHQHGVCNWLVPVNSEEQLCKACSLNQIIPDLSVNGNQLAWFNLEKAKHRLIYELIQLNLPIQNKTQDPEKGLAFNFLADATEPVSTGHLNGLITINLDEADSVEREQIRQQLSEPYRTLIGHFRHEIGHYYWDLLIQPNPPLLADFRRLFGNEQINYSEALNAYYQAGAPENWQQNFISPYASSHAWEDWAETWAHYLHIMDIVETAYYFGLSLKPVVANSLPTNKPIDFDPFTEPNFDRTLDAFISVSLAVNSFNRGMGISDVYPFVIQPAVQEKLLFIHQMLRGRQF